MPDRVLDDEGATRADGRIELAVGAVAVLGEDQIVEHHVVRQELGRGVAGEDLDGVGDELVLVGRGRPAAVDRAREVRDQRAVTLLADPQRGGVGVALGVVAHVHHDAVDGRVVEVARRHQLDRHPVAVGVADPHRVRRDVVRLGDGSDHLGRGEVEVVGVDEVEGVHPEELLRACTRRGGCRAAGG